MTKNFKSNFFLVLDWPDQALARLSCRLIKIYQLTISPDHSAIGKTKPLCGCKFYPSCSMYTIGVLKKHGFAFGLLKIIWRITRCHPWSQGGVDQP